MRYPTSHFPIENILVASGRSFQPWIQGTTPQNAGLDGGEFSQVSYAPHLYPLLRQPIQTFGHHRLSGEPCRCQTHTAQPQQNWP
jgi:hypothetical protein